MDLFFSEKFKNMTILVTGGSGFIGSNFIRMVLKNSDERVVNIDKLTYAGNSENLAEVAHLSKYTFIHGDIGDAELLGTLLLKHQPQAVINFAAESHVDRSIVSPEDFISTNVVGLFRLLHASKDYWSKLSSAEQNAFRFLQVSTDEVYGSLAPNDPEFSEMNRFEPNSPYSASKASADHLVRAYHHTYGFPTLTTNCSNNYGPFQFPEKLIPLMILNALEGKRLPIYGDGQQIRDWLYVGDHCDAIQCVLNGGVTGETYNIGGQSEMTNLEVVSKVCQVLGELAPLSDGGSYDDLIEYVTDRPGHDRRYAVDITKINRELGWQPTQSFETGIKETVQWYLEHQGWIDRVRSGEYRDWVTQQYG
jgi:dTDP-glucose 4,6-dehydratase